MFGFLKNKKKLSKKVIIDESLLPQEEPSLYSIETRKFNFYIFDGKEFVNIPYIIID